jgi:hypothetical protein
MVKFMTVLFAVLPKFTAFDSRRDSQIGHTLISGRLHSRSKECPQPQKMHHNRPTQSHSILSHLLFQWRLKEPLNYDIVSPILLSLNVLHQQI